MVRYKGHVEALLPVFPLATEIGPRAHLRIGGCDTVEMAAQFGTPLYVFDEFTLRTKCRELRREFTSRYPNSLIIYASKAFTNPALAAILAEEGMGLDVVSGGELAVAQRVKFPARDVYFHGNNKTREEMEQALDFGIGRVVVDGFHELQLLNEVARQNNTNQDILLRISPGVDPHTHAHITTGVLDSKFGFPLANGQAEEALRQALCTSNLNLVGLHCHIGSQVFETEPYRRAVEVMLRFAAEMRRKHGFELMEFSPGGGFGVQYMHDAPAPPIARYAEVIISAVLELSRELGLTPPKLIVEPGRSVVAQAGVALYTVGSIKDIPEVRKYVSLDGGMGDNIRPALYDARYEAVVANKADAPARERVTLAGRFCESGDVLVKDAMLPAVEPGNIVAIPVSGAYALTMASNYNNVPRPAIVLVRDGAARLIRRRETYEDMMARERV
ncbi:MAG: diaminopimelate decarboxylase [Chloroflexi bacterium]|nr:diaminopimelate decarboxylase [Chloroflexota bacterium]